MVYTIGLRILSTTLIIGLFNDDYIGNSIMFKSEIRGELAYAKHGLWFSQAEIISFFPTSFALRRNGIILHL